jgi:hypothetical protein
MNPANGEPHESEFTGEFDNRECVIVIDDGPGDNTVRPSSPEMLQWFARERERLAKFGLNLDGTPLQRPDDTASR